MAIVSISKIQIRRGRANSGTGLPQLSSGEMAWAIDTKELFIGNGAVSEGAPFVGNTRILTEADVESMSSATAGLAGKYLGTKPSIEGVSHRNGIPPSIHH